MTEFPNYTYSSTRGPKTSLKLEGHLSPMSTKFNLTLRKGKVKMYTNKLKKEKQKREMQ